MNQNQALHNKMKKATRIMMIVRIIAVVLIVASAAAYFWARNYAIYPAVLGFVLIALINLPLNIWLAMQNKKLLKHKSNNSNREGNNSE